MEDVLSWLPNDNTPPRACLFSVESTVLNDDEKDLFARFNPLGFILFKRNIDTPQQVNALTASLREVIGRDCPILIDQEGGRVARLKPPHWHKVDTAEILSQNPDKLKQAMQNIANDLNGCGINVNCAPVLDIRQDDTHDAIGDRAFGYDAEDVAACGDCVCRTFLDNGIVPVIKHMPGHGRATVDSHYDLPHVTELLDELIGHDFKPFRDIAHKPYADRIWGMSAHVIYESIDNTHPASASASITSDIIRKNIGFSGFLVSDDLDMAGLSQYGDICGRASAILHAGLDCALYCSGKFDDMLALEKTIPHLSDDACVRLEKTELKKVA